MITEKKLSHSNLRVNTGAANMILVATFYTGSDGLFNRRFGQGYQPNAKPICVTHHILHKACFSSELEVP